MRRDLTDAERLLWKALRRGQLGLKFRRQQPIGPFIADFVCPERRLILEVDGGQHAESPSDAARTAWLNERGYIVLRFWNHDIQTNLQGTLEAISAALKTPHPPTAARRAPPSPSRGEGIMDGAFRV
ncbi:very-short-patch-repair endonuclease [Sphingobium sp. B7D2B]|uniref:endonuclease domain-containing protein n=1 Tax=Sphingobium sp. B7D2B TaxID=2940583 RepID=UPI00222593FC|nr:DUF559 domain-containing protein [Sphingobium sp. B7D2B]MCW2364955.1 very-short-patch-repair endonuclease [Sphingobium sp. B7D2B]